jgi:hypothetical protein
VVYCDLCVKIVGAPPRQVGQCKTCGAMLTPVHAQSASMRAPARDVERASEPGLLERLPRTVLYLKDGTLLLTLAGLAILVSLLRWGGIVGLILALGLEAMVYFHVVIQSAAGVDGFDSPDTSDPWEIASMGIRYLVAIVPLVVSLIWFGLEALGGPLAGLSAAEHPNEILDSLGPPAMAVLVSVAVWPLLTVIASISKSFLTILNPVVWWKTLGVMGGDYAIGALAFYGVFLAEVFLLDPLLVELGKTVDVPFLGTALVLFVGFLPMVLRARILGEMTRPYFDL